MKIFITTSRRPSPRTRSLLKDLVSVIPYAVRVVRGHATLDKLALEAFDVGATRILVLRNWKGNPRFIDIYDVGAPGSCSRICTLHLKGFKLARECSHTLPKERPRMMVASLDIVTSGEIPAPLLECLVRGLNINVVNEVPPGCIELVITPRAGFYEVSFRMSTVYVGPVLRVWRARIYHTRLG
ncbi:MAG: hypothetical protein GXO32_06745 [Crenarchaeota archaeon]|nr:hypothetical protein [Thermoproteota archaeon]